MKQYFKMADYFVGGVSARLNNYGDVVVDYDCADPDMIVKKTMIAIEQAINSHDKLVQMNQGLLAALEWSDSQIMEFISIAFRHAEIKGDFELSDVRDALKVISLKAEGGAA